MKLGSSTQMSSRVLKMKKKENFERSNNFTIITHLFRKTFKKKGTGHFAKRVEFAYEN